MLVESQESVPLAAFLFHQGTDVRREAPTARQRKLIPLRLIYHIHKWLTAQVAAQVLLEEGGSSFIIVRGEAGDVWGEHHIGQVPEGALRG